VAGSCIRGSHEPRWQAAVSVAQYLEQILAYRFGMPMVRRRIGVRDSLPATHKVICRSTPGLEVCRRFSSLAFDWPGVSLPHHKICDAASPQLQPSPCCVATVLASATAVMYVFG
jgi:hypothetical protein